VGLVPGVAVTGLRRGIPWIAVGLAASTLVARALRSHGYVFDMVANLAALCAWGALLGGVAVLVVRARVPAAVLMGIALAHALWLMPGRAPASSTGDGPTISVLQFNANTRNPTPERILELIADADADLVSMVEVPDAAIDLLRDAPEIRERYPYRSIPTHPDERNNVRLSKHPFEVLDLVHRSNPADLREYVLGHTAIVDHPAGRFVHAMVIPLSPRSPARWAEGNATLRRELSLLVDRIPEPDLPWILGVDLNGGPGTVRADIARRVAGVRRAKPFLAAAGTWPSWAPAPVRIAIDDVLVSPGVGVREWSALSDGFGSDHVPVVVVLTLDRNSETR
jgi:endonuclease/exonuclease/phosphatase (EEP) superfamily protein YafD